MSTAERSTPPPAPGSRQVDEARTIPDDLVEAFAVTDPSLIRRLKARRQATGLDSKDEMWEGIYVVSPDPNVDHTIFASELSFVFASVRDEVGGGYVLQGGNVSDRVKGWRRNYRIPDVAVYLRGNPARNLGTHWCGGPDLAVEILSEGDLARKKLDFYARVDTRELLILDRNPWALDLYRLAEGRLVLVGVSTPDGAEVLASRVLPLAFRLRPGEDRPVLEVSRADGARTWPI